MRVGLAEQTTHNCRIDRHPPRLPIYTQGIKHLKEPVPTRLLRLLADSDLDHLSCVVSSQLSLGFLTRWIILQWAPWGGARFR